jgi:anti-sigma28 factor (negative regulator of flagellin synthesis)
MKIDNSQTNSQTVAPPGASPVRKSPTRAEQIPAPSGDQVELSGPSASAAPDVGRSERLERLRAQVQQGTYRVPAEDIASSIVDDMLGNRNG